MIRKFKTISDEEYRCCRISHITGKGFYVVPEVPQFHKSLYLWKDGTTHEVCGAANFYETIEEAKEAIDSYAASIAFLTEEEFKV